VLRSRSALVSSLRSFDRLDDKEARRDEPNTSAIFIYKMFLAKEKAVYTTLNCIKMQESTFIGYFWAPLEDEARIEAELKLKYASVIITPDNRFNLQRPTYIKTNKVTDVYQMVVDTYGIPAYREANPALLTIITFPFFFGMMFGDMGHGSIVLTFAILATLFPSMFRGGLLEPALYARYLLLLMGIMAFYCGFIYNEWFAIPTNFFGSCYDININH